MTRGWTIPACHDFYPRPPRGGRPFHMTNDGIIYNISIHALREEGDLHLLLTPVRWRVISIHALREEGDFLRIDTFP